MAPKMRLVVWFKGTNDLRVHDNPLLARAAELCKKTPGGAEVVPAFCFDPRDFGKSDFGSAKVAPHRARFLLESVADLRAQLRRQCGSDLLVSHGSPEMLIGSLVDSAPAGAVVLTSDEVASEELTAIKRVRRAVPKATLECLWMSTVYHRDDLPFALDRLPSAFTPFRDKVERGAQTRAMARTPAAGELPLPTAREELQTPTASFESLPTLEQLGVPAPTDDARGVLRFEGGETAALRRVDHYLFKADCLKTYFETRNGMLGADYSSKLSPWLAHGCLSPLKVLEEIGRYERVRVKNKSTYWLVFELLWRDYFRFFALKEGNAIFQAGGTSGERRTWASGQMAAERLRRWKDGQTGLPLVDANMRELKATGFMSNRGRQNVASYLALDLNLDWRLGADHFQATLVDHDVGANWGNWVSAAGLTGGRVNQFNIVKQSKDYDADGAYVRTWCPELAKVPTAHVHTPWEMPMDLQEKIGVRIGDDYPRPLTVPAGYARNGGGTGGAPMGARPQGARAAPDSGAGRRRPPSGGRVQRY